MNGQRVCKNGDPRPGSQGASLFSFYEKQGGLDDAFRFAHERIMGKVKIEQLRKRQREIST